MDPVKPRRHNRKPIPQNADPGVSRRRDDAVIGFDLAFRRNLPQHEPSRQRAVVGHYTQVEGDAFDGKDYPIADGLYRVNGSDWLLKFEGGGFVAAERAQPPDYGGKSVIAVAIPLKK